MSNAADIDTNSELEQAAKCTILANPIGVIGPLFHCVVVVVFLFGVIIQQFLSWLRRCAKSEPIRIKSVVIGHPSGNDAQQNTIAVYHKDYIYSDKSEPISDDLVANMNVQFQSTRTVDETLSSSSSIQIHINPISKSALELSRPQQNDTKSLRARSVDLSEGLDRPITDV